jgi:PAS domain S-box
VDMDREAIIEANSPAHELLRYDVGDLVGRSPYELHPQQPAQFEQFVDTIRADGGAVTEELRCRRGDGSTIPAAVSAARTTLDGTEMLLVTIRDNSQREQYRTQLALLARVLRHNLRNDMTVILGALTMAQDRIDDETIQERIQQAINKSKSLTETSDKTRKLNEMLEAAHEPGIETTDLVPVIEGIVDEYRETYPAANIEVACPDTAPVEASENVGWAIENLVENALVHTGEAPGLKLTIERETTTEDDQDSEWVSVTVADTGPGIPESEVEVLRDETTRSSTQHGSGLGLWIAQQIARTFHGQLDISSNPESEYSTVVSLRLQPAAEDSVNGA